MSEVQPIRDPEQIWAIAATLKEWDCKYYIMFLVGCESGLRISDILKLKVSDIKKLDTTKITEKKTHKKRYLYLNEETTDIIYAYIRGVGLCDKDYLVPSRKTNKDGSKRPISKCQAYKVIREAGERNNVKCLGTHSMRKTFGYHYYKKTEDIATLMKILNHSNPAVTLRYIGIEDEEIKNSLDKFFLFNKKIS